MKLIVQTVVLALVACVASGYPNGWDRQREPSDIGASQGPAEIMVKTLSGATIKVQIGMSATVAQLGEKIQEMTGVPCDVQKLLFEYQLLFEREKDLRSSGLGSGSPVLMVLYSEDIRGVDDLSRLVELGAQKPNSGGPESSAIASHSKIYGDPRNWIFEKKANWRVTEMFDPTARSDSIATEYAWLRKDVYNIDYLRKIFRVKCLLESLMKRRRRARWPFEYPGIRLGSTWQPHESLAEDVNNYAPDNLLDEEIMHLFEMSGKMRRQLERDAMTGEGNLGLVKQKAINQGVLLQYEGALAGFPLPSEIMKPREGETCGICRDELNVEPAIRLACDHSFHSDCIHQWINKLSSDNRESRCPYCRGPFRFPYGGVSYDDESI